MTPLISSITTLLSLLIILSQVLVVLLIASCISITQKDQKGLANVARFVSRYVLEIGFLVSFGSLIASLFYSNVAHFEPCEFCWWIRILMYPQVILFAVAWYYKRKGQPDSIATSSALILSVLGIVVAGFQYYGQMFNPSLLSACVANGASCAKLYFVSFGYITIPMMALTGFGIIAAALITHKHVVLF
jgi:disulfide bond formation protein DsbB